MSSDSIHPADPSPNPSSDPSSDSSVIQIPDYSFTEHGSNPPNVAGIEFKAWLAGFAKCLRGLCQPSSSGEARDCLLTETITLIQPQPQPQPQPQAGFAYTVRDYLRGLWPPSSSGEARDSLLLETTPLLQPQPQPQPQPQSQSQMPMKYELILWLLGLHGPKKVLLFGMLAAVLGVLFLGVHLFFGLFVDKCKADEAMPWERMMFGLTIGGFGFVPIICFSRQLAKMGLRSLLLPDTPGLEGPTHKDIPKLLVLSWFGCLVSKVVWEYDYTRRCNADLGVSVVYTFAQAFCWSWATLTFAGSCVLFRTICKYLLAHFTRFQTLLTSASDSTPLLEEHIRIRVRMAKISKIFQVYLVIQILMTMIYMVVVIFVILRYKFPRTYDYGILGLFLFAGLRECLKSAADVTDRAEGVAALSSCCHALAVSADGELAGLPELDLEDAPNAILETVPKYSQLQCYKQDSTYKKFQAFVIYAQNNREGLYIFSWSISRGLISTVLSTLLSLITFVFGCSTDWNPVAAFFFN